MGAFPRLDGEEADVSLFLSWRRAGAVAAAGLALGLALGPASAGAVIPDGARFYTPEPDPGAVEQIAELTAAGQQGAARQIRSMVETPQAVWFTDGSGDEVTRAVGEQVRRAAGQKALPVLVAYNIPFRDCAQYSAGGAGSVQEYRDWIDAFAAGIGSSPAAVLLEPDGLGIIPWYTANNGGQEWCQPAEADPATAAADRFAMLRYAVDRLAALPRTSVYLDGVHSGWLSVGDIADRLVKAGVRNADGFFLNVSNYQSTERQLKFGNWISQCVWYGTEGPTDARGHFERCASQYYPADPADFSTWPLTDAWYAANVGTVAPELLAHYVVDTSRNGQGPWTPPADASWPDPQVWCNPPGRGLGLRPTTRTGEPLADAFLWVKTPGQSDGQCDRGTGTGTDPARGGSTDPAAGAWFPEQAIELVRLANPPLR